MSIRQAWSRREVDAAEWTRIGEQLTDGRWVLFGLWGDRNAVHMALLAPAEIMVVTLACPDGEFPSIARHHAPALRLERTVAELYGLVPLGGADSRNWLDHGCWPESKPLAGRPCRPIEKGYEVLGAEGEGLHQIPVGPVHAGIIEPGHFRFTANGETIVRLEERLGYTHKGIERQLAKASLDKASRITARLSGDSTVACSLAFARAVEDALGIEAPPRAHWLRALMSELERVANHLGDIGAVCNDAAFALMHAHTGVLRERVLRQAQAAFGHRLMMDRIVPGGVITDLDDEAMQGIQALVGHITAVFPRLVTLYDETASLQNRTVDTGRLSHGLARQFGCGGFIGRASARDFDARRALAYPPYNQLEFEVPLLQEGDVNARVWVRIREIEQSLALIEQLLDRLPAGQIAVALPQSSSSGEGLALVEGFRGDILCWVRIDAQSRVERCHLRDPSWFQWPLLEAAIEGNIVADFPLCNKSFNCSYSGHDM